MNNLNSEQDPRLEKIQNFMDNWRAKHGDTDLLTGHNVYLLQTEDRDGNITGEAFALNVTTWRYFWSYFAPNDGSRPYNTNGYIDHLYIGDGTHEEYGDFPTTRNTMFHQTYTGEATRSANDLTRIEGGTIYYDQDTGLLRGQAWVFTGYFDYVLSGIDSDLTVTEVGLSAQNVGRTELASHAYVLDSEGHYASFQKKVNEKLTITAYIINYHKPGYIENKLWAQGVGFAWNPWGAFAFGRPGQPYSWSWAYNGTADITSHAIISSPRWNTNNQRRYENDTSTRANRIVTGAHYFLGNMAANATDQTMTSTKSFANINSLIENKGYYYDLLVMSISNQYGEYNNSEYTAQGALIKEMRLPEPEEIVTNYAYTGTINNKDLSANFGHQQNAAYDTRGLLPITNLNISAVKSYNGLTKEWDIDETVTNGTNEVNLTMNQMYPWVGIYMNCPYLEATTVKWGRQFVRIYFNMYTQFPITKMETSHISASNIWCSDQYWNPYSWERIEDPTNISTAQGTKRYYMGFGGEITGNGGPNTQTKPVVVTRACTKPELVSEDTIRIDSIDTFNNGNYGYTNGQGNYMRYHENFQDAKLISNDSMGYIWMRDHLYYPDDSDLSTPGASWQITTAHPVGQVSEPITTLRFTEPSGHRILQMFTSNNYNGQASICLQKVSVFDIHSAAEVAQDPLNVQPTEYEIDMGDTFPNNITINSQPGSYRITSTETGYVVFGNGNDTRTYVVNILGDAEHNYEPYKFILTYPDTGEEINSSNAFAMKYTSKVVVRSPRSDTDTLMAWIIIDLSDNSIVDEFTIEKNSWGGDFIWGAGWNDYFYMLGRASTSSFDANTVWRCRIYDGTRSVGNRIVDPEWSSDVCKAMLPAGKTSSDWWKRYCWHQIMAGTLEGDEECFCFGDWNVDENTNMRFYYVDIDKPLSPFNFSNVGITGTFKNTTTASTRLHFDVLKTPDGKQRLLVVSLNCTDYYISNTRYWLQMETYIFDANLVRDMRTGPGRINSNQTSLPRLISISNTSYATYGGWRYFCMYKGRVLMSEYQPEMYYNYVNYESRWFWRTGNIHRFIDPKRLFPHQMTGTTYTIQAYNNPKRVYGIQSYMLKFINSTEYWDPSDLPPGE